MADVQRKMTTGLEVERLSDDPTRAGEILALQSRINRTAQYTRNIDGGIANLRMTENSLSHISDVLSNIRARAIEGSNGALSAEDRIPIAAEIEQYLREIVHTANQKFGNYYLFGGAETRNPPYEIVEDEEGVISEVNALFEEPPGHIERIVSEGERMDFSVGALDTFDLGDGETLFGILFDLHTALLEDDVDAIGETLPRIDAAIDQISSLTALIGSRVGAAETLRERLETEDIRLQDRFSELTDVDIIEIVTQFNIEQTAYEMSLRAAAKVVQPSLVNFVL